MLRLTASLVVVQQMCIIHYVYFNVCGDSTTEKPDGKVRLYNPNFGYEPYWPGGDWVQVLPTDPSVSTSSTTPVPMVCGRECHYLYRPIKKVCSRYIHDVYLKGCRIDGKKKCTGWPADDLAGGYTTFESYCELLDKQCKTADPDKPIHNWIFVHVGECEKNQDLYFKPMFETEPVTRREEYLAALNATFEKLEGTPEPF